MFSTRSSEKSNNNTNTNKQSLFSLLPNVESNIIDNNKNENLKVIKDIVKGNRPKFDSRNIDITNENYKYQSPKPPDKMLNSNNSIRAPRPVYDSNYSPLSYHYQENRYQDNYEQKTQNDDYYKTTRSKIVSKVNKSNSRSLPKSKGKIKSNSMYAPLDFNINSNLTTMIAAWKIKYFVTLVQKKRIKLELQKQIRYLNRELDKRTAQLNDINNKYSSEKNSLLIELDSRMAHEAEINKELGQLRQHHENFRSHNSELINLVQKIDNKKAEEKNMDLQDLIDSYKREIQVQIEQVGKLNIYKELHEREVSKNEVLKTELEVTRKTCQELIFKLSTHEVELDVRRMSESQKEKELNKEINNLKGVIKLQEKEIQDNYERIEGLEKALLDFRDGIEVTVKDLKQNFKTELGNKQDEITNLLQQMETMKHDKERESANIMASLAQQIAEVQLKEREVAKNLSNSFEEERKLLLSKLSMVNVDTMQIIKEKEEKEKIIEEMNNLLITKDDDIKYLNKNLNQLTKDKVVVQEIIETIAGKSKYFESDNEALKEEVGKLNTVVGQKEVMILSLKDNIKSLESKLQAGSMALEHIHMTNEDNEENLRVTKSALVNTSGYCRFIEEQLFMARKGGEVVGVIASKSSNSKVKSKQESRSFIDSFGFLPSNIIDENQEPSLSVKVDNSSLKPTENISALENRLSSLISTLEDKIYSNNAEGNFANLVDIANTVPKPHENGVIDDKSKQMKREAKEKVDNIRIELDHDVNLCMEYIDEIYDLANKKEKIRHQLQQWEKDFFGLCGRNPDTADKKRSNIFSSICTEYMQIQRNIRDKYDEAKMLVAELEEIRVRFDEARGVVEMLTGKKPDDFKYKIVLPDEVLTMIENPFLNRKHDEDKEDKIENEKIPVTLNDDKKIDNPNNLIKGNAKRSTTTVGIKKAPTPTPKIVIENVADEITKVTDEIAEFEKFILKIDKDIAILSKEEKSIDLKIEEWNANFVSNHGRDANIAEKVGIEVFDQQAKLKQKLIELEKQKNSTKSFMVNSKLLVRNLNQKLSRR